MAFRPLDMSTSHATNGLFFDNAGGPTNPRRGLGLMNARIANILSHFHIEQNDTTKLGCPVCESTFVYRTPRKGLLERIVLYPLGYRAYVCDFCSSRFRSKLLRN